MAKKRTKLATPEQLAEIDEGIKKLGIGESLDDFVKKFNSQEYKAMFAKSLTKNLRALQKIAQLDTHNGSYQAVLSENMFQDININPSVASSDELEKWLMQPAKFDDNIRSLSQYLNYAVGQYNALLWITNTSKAFNYVLLPNQYDISDVVKTKDYKNKYKTACELLRKLNIKSQFAKIDLQVLFDGVAFYYVDKTTEE